MKRVKTSMLIVLMVVAALLVSAAVNPSRMLDNVTVLRSLKVQKATTIGTTLSVGTDATITDDVTVGGDASVTGDVAITGDLGADDVAVDGFLNLAASTYISVTAGATITPTATFQPIKSGGAVTTSTSRAIADGVTTGDVLVLQNQNASSVITVDGTGGNVECKTDKALGAGDTLTLIWNGTNWYCISLADNS